ncbi:MAG TPA: hypothetical protein EYG34_00815 [Acidimicrobiia bacterium]|jgi:hypothetical protein|nr:hypothetical protein [Acidimicrobiia bacterium]HIL45648.1 hypothetical protein [Acidimicrobiia bacterium]
MMATILGLIILAMVFQGVMAVINSILDLAGVNGMLKGLPLVGTNLNLIWAYLFVMLSEVGALGYGGVEIAQLGDFGTDVATAIAIVAFIPVKDAAISALGKGLARG